MDTKIADWKKTKVTGKHLLGFDMALQMIQEVCEDSSLFLNRSEDRIVSIIKRRWQ